MVVLPLFIPGGIGTPELVIIMLLAVLLFGADKIPELARSTGQAMSEFQRGRHEIEHELQESNETAATTTTDTPTTDSSPTTPAAQSGDSTESNDSSPSSTETDTE